MVAGLGTKFRRRYGRRKRNMRRRFLKKSFKSKFNTQIGFPRTNLVKMRYCDTITFSPSISPVLTPFAFRANGIFDPYVGVGGHQPLGHDQWANFYEKYTVYRSEAFLKVTCVNNTSTAAAIGIYLSSDSSLTATTVNELQEQGKSRVMILSPTTNGNSYTLNNYIKMVYNAKKWHGVTNVKDAENLESDFGADPTDQTYFIVFLGPMDPLAASLEPVITFNITINYYVLCKDPKELPQS